MLKRVLLLCVCSSVAACVGEVGEEEEWEGTDWSADEGDLIGEDEIQGAITCNGPQGDAFGNGPNGPGVIRAIRDAWGSNCREGQAIAVAKCEGGHWANCCLNGGGTRAHHGTASQYKGMFQMGSWERSTYGFNWCATAQARGAHHYFVDSGRDWSPWACKPGFGC